MTPRFTELTYAASQEILRLHRLALAAEDLESLRSPVTPVSAGDDRISRPTEGSALCPRRAHLSAVVRDATKKAASLAEQLESAIAVWEGHEPLP